MPHPHSATSATLGNFLEIPVLRPHSTESGALEWSPAKCLNKPSRWCWCMLKFEKHFSQHCSEAFSHYLEQEGKKVTPPSQLSQTSLPSLHSSCLQASLESTLQKTKEPLESTRPKWPLHYRQNNPGYSFPHSTLPKTSMGSQGKVQLKVALTVTEHGEYQRPQNLTVKRAQTLDQMEPYFNLSSAIY